MPDAVLLLKLSPREALLHLLSSFGEALYLSNSRVSSAVTTTSASDAPTAYGATAVPAPVPVSVTFEVDGEGCGDRVCGGSCCRGVVVGVYSARLLEMVGLDEVGIISPLE